VFQTAFPPIKSRWAKAQTVGLIFSLELRLSLFHPRSPGFLCFLGLHYYICKLFPESICLNADIFPLSISVVNLQRLFYYLVRWLILYARLQSVVSRLRCKRSTYQLLARCKPMFVMNLEIEHLEIQPLEHWLKFVYCTLDRKHEGTNRY